ncbi:MAG: peptidase M17, partial [Treponema sp.]|nr:peptidase M17 [Treponema sp.]
MFDDLYSQSGVSGQRQSQLRDAARIAIEVSLKVKSGERLLIIANPEPDSAAISGALYDASLRAGASPALIFQPRKSQLDFAEPAVISAIGSRPDIIVSISADKMGKDPRGIASPFEYEGVKYDSIFHLLLNGEKCCRSFWSPSVTIDSFLRTIPIDYSELTRRCAAIREVLDLAAAVYVTAPGGTDITIGLLNRKAKSDDGDFSRPGGGGNLPAGETFISPVNGTARGRICFDGSMSVSQGTILIREPIRCLVENGFVTDITGGSEAALL